MIINEILILINVIKSHFRVLHWCPKICSIRDSMKIRLQCQYGELSKWIFVSWGWWLLLRPFPCSHGLILLLCFFFLASSFLGKCLKYVNTTTTVIICYGFLVGNSKTVANFWSSWISIFVTRMFVWLWLSRYAGVSMNTLRSTHMHAKSIKLGVGDTTEPIPDIITSAMAEVTWWFHLPWNFNTLQFPVSQPISLNWNAFCITNWSIFSVQLVGLNRWLNYMTPLVTLNYQLLNLSGSGDKTDSISKSSMWNLLSISNKDNYYITKRAVTRIPAMFLKGTSKLRIPWNTALRLQSIFRLICKHSLNSRATQERVCSLTLTYATL